MAAAGHDTHAAAADRILSLDTLRRDLQASRLREQRLKEELFSAQIALRTAQSLIAMMAAPYERPH